LEIAVATWVKGKFDGAPVRLPINEETAWERAQHEKFRARWGGDPFKGCLFFWYSQWLRCKPHRRHCIEPAL